MNQPRRPAGTPVGGQFAATNRPRAADLGLSEDSEPATTPVTVGLDNVDWEQLRDQKAHLTFLSSHSSPVPGKEHLEGILSLLDNLQDQAAEILGEDAVFGDLGDDDDMVATGSMGETEACDECGAELVDDELVTDQHETWCSLHPDNVVDAQAGTLPHADDPRVESSGGVDEYRRFVQQSSGWSTGLAAPAPAPTRPVPPARYASLREALDAESETWTWTGIAAEIGKERAAELFERSGGSLGTALALASAAGSIANAATGNATTEDDVVDAEPATLLSGGLPVALQAHLLRTGNATGEVARSAADRLESQHEALRAIQALLSAPDWEGADFLEEIDSIVAHAGYANADYRPEVGERIELHLADSTVVGQIELIDGDETLVVPDGGGRSVRVPTTALEWDQDARVWFHAPDEDR